MKNSVKSNMYEDSLAGTWELFGSYLEGVRQALVCVVSSSPLEARSRSALQSTFAQLGYGKEAGTFLFLEGNDASSDTPPLAGKELFAAIEGLDPVLVIITDKEASAVCSEAYHQDIPLDQRTRVLGREVRAFSSFETMLEDPKKKQAAWGLLKSLPKLQN